jgi:hypothetical protein
VESEYGQNRLQWENERNILKQTLSDYESKVSKLTFVYS